MQTPTLAMLVQRAVLQSKLISMFHYALKANAWPATSLTMAPVRNWPDQLANDANFRPQPQHGANVRTNA